MLPTGQRITPAGSQLAVPSLPIAIEPTPDARHLLVLHAGYETPTLSAVDVRTMTLSGRVTLADAWLGLTVAPSGDRAYVGGGARGSVWEIAVREGSLRLEREFPLGGDCRGRCDSLIGDVRLDADGRLLYALDVLRDRVVIVNTQSGLVLGEFATGFAPYRARQTTDREHLVISHWGEASLGLYRLSDRRLVERIPVGEHPTDILIVEGQVSDPRSQDDSEERIFPARLFVASAHSDNLWTFGIAESGRFEFLDARSVAPLAASPLGSLPSALALSADGTALYVLNSGNNTILVTDVGEALPEPSGALPTGWFPTAVAALPDGTLAYASGKGDGDHGGMLALVPPLGPDQMDLLTSAAVANLAANPAPSPGPPPDVRHVALVLADTRGPGWHTAAEDGAVLERYLPFARGQLAQTALLTSGMESDFFVKLAPAVTAGRLSATALAGAGRAALPAAGTLWANARQAGLEAQVYGIAGGSAANDYIALLESGSDLPALAVVRLAGPPESQDAELARIVAAVREHSLYGAAALFAATTAGAPRAAVFGGAVRNHSLSPRFVSPAAVLRTIVWLLGIRPMTQLVMAADPLSELFRETP